MFSRQCRAAFCSVLKGAAYLVPAIGTGLVFRDLTRIEASTPEGYAVLFTVMVSSLTAASTLASSSLSSLYESFKTCRSTPPAPEPLEEIEIIEVAEANTEEQEPNNTSVVEAKAENRCGPGTKSVLNGVLFLTTTFSAGLGALVTYAVQFNFNELDKYYHPYSNENLAPYIYRDASLWLAAVNFLVKSIQEGRKTCSSAHNSHAGLFGRQTHTRLLDNSTPVESNQLAVVRR